MDTLVDRAGGERLLRLINDPTRAFGTRIAAFVARNDAHQP
jgi:hypothetical protein